MMANSQLPSDDFFSLLEKEQKENQAANFDEIIFRDESGKMKVLKGGQIFDYPQKGVIQPASIKAHPLKPAVPLPSPAPMPAKLPPAPSSPPAPPAEPVVVVRDANKSSAPALMPLEEQVAFNQTLPQMPAFARRQISLDTSGSQINYQTSADEIMAQSQVKLSDPDLEKRLKNIVISNLKNIRDRLETSEMLLSSTLEGGVGLSPDLAEKILDLSDKKREEFLQTRPRNATTPIIPSSPAQEIPVSAPKPPIPEKPMEKKPEPIPEKPAAKPLPPLPRIEMKKNPAVEFKLPARPIVPKSEEVKFKPQLLGPVEEIRTLSLADFRRLDPDPNAATEKIMERINLLQEQSLVEMVRGIKAWKDCEVYRLYISLGAEAMDQRRSISEVIAQRQAANQPSLTEAEIEAIMDLNEKLRY